MNWWKQVNTDGRKDGGNTQEGRGKYDILDIKSLKFLCNLQMELSIRQLGICLRSSGQASNRNGHSLVLCHSWSHSGILLLLRVLRSEKDQSQKLRNTDIWGTNKHHSLMEIFGGRGDLVPWFSLEFQKWEKYYGSQGNIQEWVSDNTWKGTEWTEKSNYSIPVKNGNVQNRQAKMWFLFLP